MRKIVTLTLFALSLIAVFALTSCGGSDETPTGYTLQELLDIALERRENIERPGHDRLLEFAKGREPETIWMGEFYSHEQNHARTITSKEAIEDVRLFFTALRQIYSLYIYFGGDMVFASILDEIEAEISANETLIPFQLENIIFNALRPIISDNHFLFGSRLLGADATFFTSDTPFDRHGQGFRHRESGLIAVEIEGRNINEVLRLSMDEEGNTFYSPIVYELDSIGIGRRNLNIIFEDGSTYRLPLERLQPAGRPYRRPSLEWVDGLPVVTIMSMGFPHEGGHNYHSAQAFLGFAEELRNEPIIILDMRSSQGGNNLLGDQWLYALIGKVIPSSFLNLTTTDYESLLSAISFPGLFTLPFDVYMRFSPITPFDENHSIWNRNLTDGIVANEQLIVVLVDRFTVSAAEGFVDLMFSLQNSLVIGQNTRGVLASDGTYTVSNLALPNSGIPFGFGRGAAVFPEGHFTEGVGIAPDIWVHGDALQAALALLARYSD